MICFTLVFALSLSTTIIAQEQQKVRGLIIKMDIATKSVTLRTKNNSVVTVVLDDPRMFSKIKEEMTVEAKYVVKDGVNAAFKIRQVVEGCTDAEGGRL
jgi:Cu/Ag efflux protein CusF